MWRRNIIMINVPKQPPLVEDVPEVGVAPSALHFCPPHAVACIGFGVHRLFAGRSVETRPPGARMELGFGTKEGLAATDAPIGAGRFGVLIFAGERRLSAFLPRYIVLILRKLLLPGRVILTDLSFHGASSPVS